MSALGVLPRPMNPTTTDRKLEASLSPKLLASPEAPKEKVPILLTCHKNSWGWGVGVSTGPSQFIQILKRAEQRNLLGLR